MCQPVAVPNAKWPQVLLCGRDTGCQAHSWCDAPDLALPRYTSLPCNCSELREGGEWHSGFLTRAVSILCMGTKALWNGMREKQSEKQHCTRLLRNAVKNFQNEKFPTRSMPHSPCVRRGREAWTPEMWTREKGNLATAPGRALALLCADKLTRLEAACTSPDLNRLLSNFIPCLTRRLFGITFSQSGKSVFKDVLTPRAGTCCQFSCCEDPEFTSQNFPVLSRHGFLIIFFFKSKKWKMTAAVWQSS